MASLALKKPVAIKGRASISGDYPSFQIPIEITSPREVPKYPNGTPPLSPNQSEATLIKPKKITYVISESSMHRFSEFITDLKNLCQSLTEVNFCPIIHEVELVEQVDILNYLFQPFYTESLKFLHALHVSEIDNTYVGSTALKQAAFPFVEQWKHFVQLVNKVRDNGIQSMAKYLQIKFEIIYSVIHGFETNQKIDSVHVEEVVKAATTLHELVTQIDKGINYLILQTDLSQMSTDILESKIRDLRTLYRLYESEHNSEFCKSGFSICDLHQLRSNVQSAILDIIGGLKAAFSFHDDIEKIYGKIDDIQKMLTRVSEQINLPQTIVHTAKKKVITDHILTRKRQKDHLKDVKDFVKEIENIPNRIDSESHIVICGKLELYIEKVSSELGIKAFDKQIDVWERLNRLQEEVVRKIRASKELENEYGLFQEKIQTQSGHITTLMKNNNRKTAENEAIERRLNQKISDLEERNQEMLKQRNEALTITKRREEQLFKLRLKYNENGTYRALQEVTQVLSRFLNIPIPDSKDLPKSAMDLSFTLNKRGCLKCNQYKDTEADIRRRIEKVIPVKPTDTIVNVVSELLAEYQKMKYQLDMTQNTNSHVESDINSMKDCLKMIEMKSNEILSANNDNVERKRTTRERSATELTKDTSNAFMLLLNLHKKEIETITRKFTEKRQSELSNIMSHALSLFHPEKVSKSDDVTEMIISVLKSANDEFDRFKLENRNKDDVIEKITTWMKTKTNENHKSDEEEQSIEKMMTMIDKEENPLENVVYEQKVEKDKIHREVHMIVTKIKGICNINDQTDYMELNNLLKFANAVLDKLHDKVEKEASSVVSKANDKKYVTGELITLNSRLKNILDDNSIVDFSKESISSLLKNLHVYLDQLSSEKQFIRIDTINKLTYRLRKEELDDIPHSLDPKEYLPMINQKIEPIFNTIDLIKKLLSPMLDVFKNFDFKIKSYSPQSEVFDSLKKSVLEMHDILKNARGDMVPDCIAFLSKDLSLISSLIGFIGIAVSS